MPISDAYCDNTKYKAIIGKLSGDNDSEIDAQLLAGSRYIERKLGRFFNKDGTALTRLYVPGEVAYGAVLQVNDMAAAPTLIRIDADRSGTYETTLAATDYELLPRNALRGPEVQPYRQIRLLSGGAYTAWNLDGLVEVTAVWGWPAVPEAIIQGLCQVVAILRLESPRATMQLSQGFDSAIGASREAQDIVEQLQRVYGRAWVYA